MSTALADATEPEPEPEDRLHEVPSSTDVAAGVRRQAVAIIEHVMQSAPANHQEQLRSFQEAFAGRPELALAEFLRAVRPNISDYDGSGA